MSIKKPSVLFILHLPPPIHGAGVVGQFIFNSELLQSNFDRTFINLSTANSLADIGRGGVKKILNYFLLHCKLIKILFTKKFNLCYITATTHGAGFYKDFLLIVWLKLFGVPLVYHFHNKGVKDYQHRRLDNCLYRVFFRNAKVILLSRELYRDIEKYVSEKDVFFCTNGIPEANVKKEDNSNRTPIEDILPVKILFFSNMMESKGVFVLLEACKLLFEQGHSFECHFAGAWSEFSEEDFKHKVYAYGVSSVVKIHGPLFGEPKQDLFRQCDIFVFPTFYHNECVPLVIIEAMQAALPVVSTFEGGIPSIVDDKVSGFLVIQNDSASLANHLSILLIDKSLRIQFGKNGYQKYLDQYTLTHFENRLLSILQLNLKHI